MKKWTEIFKTGVDELDQDHQRLLRVAEQIAIRADRQDSDAREWTFLVREGLHYMQGYLQSHMEREEAYMRSINYPYYDTHKQAHDQMNQHVAAFMAQHVDDHHCQKEDVLTLLGTVYGWNMLHTATDDMALVGKGVLAQPMAHDASHQSFVKELDAMLNSLLGIRAHTRIVDDHYQGKSMISGGCQRMVYHLGDRDVDVFAGAEGGFIRSATQVFWADEVAAHHGHLNHARKELIRWGLTAFMAGFWRNAMIRLSHQLSCTLKEVTTVPMRDARKVLRLMDPQYSILYETSIGRFFVAGSL